MVVRKGDPVLVLVLEAVKGARREKVRCARCEGPAPPDLPPLIERREPDPARTFTRVGALRLPLGAPPADWKTRAAEREPGEEG